MHLTPNAVKLFSQNAIAHPLLKAPIVQVLTIDKHVNLVHNQERIKANLSDGTHFIKSIFSSKYTKHFENAIKQNSLIKIGSFEIRGKGGVFVYVTELLDYMDCKEVIGNPMNISTVKEQDMRNEVFSRQNSVKVESSVERGGGDKMDAVNIDSRIKINDSARQTHYGEKGTNLGNIAKEEFVDYNNTSNRNTYKTEQKNTHFEQQANQRPSNTTNNNQANFDATKPREQKYTHRQDEQHLTRNNHNDLVDNNPNSKNSSLFPENKAKNVFPPNTTNKSTNVQNLQPDKMHNEKLRRSMDNRSDTKKQNTGITPISSLNPFTNNYTIKGRCLSKSDIKTFKNQKGDGKLFSAVLADETGTIKIAAFSEVVDMFYSMVEINKVYSITGGQVRMANKKFSNTTSEYEIHLDRNTKLNLVYDEATPKYYFKFVKISDLLVNTSVDIVGVVKDVFALSTVTLKSTGKEQSKRDVNLIDDTGFARLTLWGNNAETELSPGDCIVINNTLVREYNGISLSTSASSTVYVNLMIDECYALKGWYEQVGKSVKFERKTNDTPKLISDIKEHEIKYSQFIATIVFVKEDNLFYNSCVECNKKVIEEDGHFRCERCNKTFDTCNPRYLARLEVGDFTDQIWINIFDDQCKSMIGVDAKDLETENVKNLYARDFMFKAVAKAENYQGETKNKYNIREVVPVDYLSETKRLLKCIKESI